MVPWSASASLMSALVVDRAGLKNSAARLACGPLWSYCVADPWMTFCRLSRVGLLRVLKISSRWTMLVVVSVGSVAPSARFGALFAPGLSARERLGAPG